MTAKFCALAPVHPPPEPRRGMKFWVQWGSHYCLGTNHSITRVNGRSFYVATEGRCERYLRVEWAQWLMGRFAEGKVHMEGHPLIPPQELANGEDHRTATFSIDLVARDNRFFRAAKEVLGTYDIGRSEEEPGTVCFRVKNGSSDYCVEVSRVWAHPPRCSCPDAQYAAAEDCAGYCKHVIAVLLDNEDLRFQLLDLLL